MLREMRDAEPHVLACRERSDAFNRKRNLARRREIERSVPLHQEDAAVRFHVVSHRVTGSIV
jgi:hypothetical protein